MKIKHKYKVHHFLDTYPTEEDALFDICTYLYDRGKIEEEWSDLGIKVAFLNKISEEEIEKLLHSLVLQNYLSVRDGNGKRKYYTVLKHDFENSFPLHTIK